VAFGRQDVASPGFQEAVAAARDRGFASVVRLAGGRAAVFHEGTIAFALTRPDPDPTSRTFARFREMADVMASALRRLRIDARVGEIPGEYCPGDYSVNARGKKKLVGIGQRLISLAAHTGGVLVATGAERVRGVLVPVYDALAIEWRPETAGSVEEESGAGWGPAREALITEFEERYGLTEAGLDRETLSLAESLEDDHRIPAPG
jgi:octanoyl-[GcvH]:protein N-octanoyltransferase